MLRKASPQQEQLPPHVGPYYSSKAHSRAEGFTLHLENLSNCQVSSNPQPPKKLVSKLCDCSFSFRFLFLSFVGHSKIFSDGLRSSTSCWVSGQKKMERSQAHAAQQEAAKGARGVESRGNFLNRGQFFSSCG